MTVEFLRFRRRTQGGIAALVLAGSLALTTPRPAAAQTAAPVHTLSGTVTLEGVLDDAGDAKQTITFELSASNGGSVFVRTATLDANGGYSLPNLPAGVYALNAKGAKWLRSAAQSADLTTNDATLAISLNGGDVDGDNTVGPTDFSFFVSAYNTQSTDANYDTRCDFTCNGSVDPTDFAIFLNNYNTQGELYALSLTATAGSGQVALSWDAVSGATYNLYRSANPAHGGTPYRTGLTNPAFTDTNVPNGTYYYQVVATGTNLGLSNEARAQVTTTGGTASRTAETGAATAWEAMVSGVNTVSGNKLTELPLVSWTARGGLPVSLALSHNSQGTESGPLGPRWTHSFDLTGTTDGAGNVTLHSGDGRLTQYTKNGNAFTPPPGFHSTLTQNANGSGYTLVTKSQITYQYDANLRCQSITDANGNTITLDYTGGPLHSVTDPTHRAILFAYNAGGQLTQITDPLLRVWTLAYDTASNLHSVTEPELENAFYSTVYTYDTANHITNIKTRKGPEWTFGYDAQGKQTAQADPLGNQTTFAYTNLGSLNAAVVTDANGNSDAYAYDGSLLKLVEDAEGYVAQAQYDVNYNFTQITDWRGKVWQYQDYDQNGNCRTEIDPANQITRYTFDGFSNLLSVTDPLHNPSSSNLRNHTAQYAYDAHNNLVSITDGLNHTQNYLYDNSNGATGFGLLLQSSDAQNFATHYSNFDANGNACTITDARGHSTTYQFDALGQATGVTLPLGNGFLYSYDAWNRLTAVTRTAGTRANPLLGPTLDAPADTTVTYDYDPNDNPTRVTDELNHHTDTTYDNADRPLTVKDNQTNLYHGTTGDLVTYCYDQIGWDGQTQYGLLSSITDGGGHSTHYNYTARNELARTYRPNGITHSFAYDEAGSKKRDWFNHENPTQYDYDDSGQLQRVLYPSGGSVTYAYYANGLPRQMNDRTGISYYTYDDANRLTQVGRDRGYSGHLATATNYDYYDNDWRKTTWIGAIPAPPNAVYHYTYYNNGALHTETAPYSAGVVSLTYDANEQRATQTAPNGMVSTYLYDAVDRLVDVTHCRADTQVLAHFGYRFDAADNVLTAINPDDSLTNYAYDEIHQVKRETRVKTSPHFKYYDFAYAYDHAHNRVSKKWVTDTLTATTGNDLTGPTEDYTYNAGGDLIAVEGLGDITDFGYDTHGNTNSATDGDGNPKWTLTAGFGDEALVFYKPFKSPVAIEYDGNSQYTKIDGLTCVLDENGTLLSEDDLALLAMVDTPPSSNPALGVFLVGDGGGNNTGGGASYDSFGNPVNGSAAGGYGQQNGARTDAGTGLIYRGSDVYDPRTGRSMTAPPEDDEGSLAHDHDHDRMYQTGPHPGVEGVHQFVGYLGDVGDFFASFNPYYSGAKGITGYDMFGRPISGLERALCLLPLGGKLAEALQEFCLLACFTEGTPVAMADGSFKAIDKIAVGDKVLSRAPNAGENGKIEAKTVTQRFVHVHPATVQLSFLSGETIETTSEHPFYVQGEGFVPAGQLAIGNAIVTRAGPPDLLVSVTQNNKPKTVYNLEVADDHTYFVGKNGGGLWVHNVCVYQAFNRAGKVIYVGITNNFARRLAQHGTRFEDIRELTNNNLTRQEARGVEQALMNQMRRTTQGGPLVNRINSIAPTNPIYRNAVRRGSRILRGLGYPGF